MARPLHRHRGHAAQGLMCRRAWLSAAVLAAGVAVAAAAPVPTGQATARVSYTRLYAGPDGVSHFEAAQLLLTRVPGAPGLQGVMPVNLLGDATHVSIARLAHGVIEDWHIAPARTLMLCLEGRVEITAGDGHRRRLLPGQLMLLEDTQGRGHITHVVGHRDHVALAMTVPADWPGTPPAGRPDGEK